MPATSQTATAISTKLAAALTSRAASMAREEPVLTGRRVAASEADR